MSKRKASPEETRSRLIDAGLNLFGLKGFEATRTRELATLAKVNQAAIPYHFGGKEGLYLAVAQSVVERGREDMGERVSFIKSTIESGAVDKKAAGKLLMGLLFLFADRIAMSADINDRSRFIMREYSTPGKGFEIIYEGFLSNVHTLLCNLVGIIVDESPTDETTIIRTHMMFGNIISIIVTRTLLFRRLGWDDYDQEKMDKIKKVIAESVAGSLQLGDPKEYMEAL